MRIKYLAIYIFVGVAFLAASLWVFLSDGRSARAIRTKYRLGGILLMASAMLAAASCGRPPFVTCYDVVAVDYVSVYAKEKGGTEVKSGDVLSIQIPNPTYPAFRCRITSAPEDGKESVLQEEDFVAKDGLAEFEMTVVTDYKGSARLTVYGLSKNADGTQTETILPNGIVNLTIL